MLQKQDLTCDAVAWVRLDVTERTQKKRLRNEIKQQHTAKTVTHGRTRPSLLHTALWRFVQPRQIKL